MMADIVLSCGHSVPPGGKWVSRGSDTICHDCMTKSDRACIADPATRDFTALIHADGRMITNAVGGKLGTIEDLVNGVYCFVRTPDNRLWRSIGAWKGSFTIFKLVGT